MQKLHDAMMSAWTRIFNECLGNGESLPRKLFLEQKEALTSISM